MKGLEVPTPSGGQLGLRLAGIEENIIKTHILLAELEKHWFGSMPPEVVKNGPVELRAKLTITSRIGSIESGLCELYARATNLAEAYREVFGEEDIV